MSVTVLAPNILPCLLNSELVKGEANPCLQKHDFVLAGVKQMCLHFWQLKS